MKKTIYIISSIILLSSCQSTKKLTSLENNIKENYSFQDYALVVENYKALSSASKNKKHDIPEQLTLLAAKSEYNLNNYESAINLFSSVENKDEESLFMHGMSYSHINNTQDEYQYWLKNSDKIKTVEKEQIVLERQYNLAYDFEKYEDADVIWGKIENKDNLELMLLQLLVLTNINEKDKALSLSNAILKKENSNEDALFFRGSYFFEKAESLYQSEMAKYNKDPNYTAYAYLRRELKKASADYRNAKDIFEKLHKISPDNKKYIAYLKNSYLRLEMRNEAAKMDKLLGN